MLRISPARAYGTAAAICALDQASKVLAAGLLTPYLARPLLPGLNLTLVYNTGAAFSFLSQAGGWQRWGLAGFAAAVSVALAVAIARLPARDALTRGAFALILGGALGNLLDRVRLGVVVDFVDVYAGQWHWPAFNLADSAITLGAAWLVLGALRDGHGTRKPAA